MPDAAEWAGSAMEKRPWRTNFFARIAAEIQPVLEAEVLELGSGPGFLAAAVLASAPGAKYTLLDFSDAMHELARQRLEGYMARTKLVTADFKHSDWCERMGSFDFVVTMQAIHELRHKAHAVALHAQVKKLLKPSGAYLVCDHYVGTDGMSNTDLYMTVAEQRAALEAAGFRVAEVMRERGLVLHRAARS